jgi:F0F1-type ATP synthase assembly protein I
MSHKGEPARPAARSSEENPSASPANPASRHTANVFVFAGIGMMNAICILIGTGLGWLVGRQLGTTPELLLLGMVLGIACGAFGTFKQVRKYLKD